MQGNKVRFLLPVFVLICVAVYFFPYERAETVISTTSPEVPANPANPVQGENSIDVLITEAAINDHLCNLKFHVKNNTDQDISNLMLDVEIKDTTNLTIEKKPLALYAHAHGTQLATKMFACYSIGAINITGINPQSTVENSPNTAPLNLADIKLFFGNKTSAMVVKAKDGPIPHMDKNNLADDAPAQATPPVGMVEIDNVSGMKLFQPNRYACAYAGTQVATTLLDEITHRFQASSRSILFNRIEVADEEHACNVIVNTSKGLIRCNVHSIFQSDNGRYSFSGNTVEANGEVINWGNSCNRYY